MKKVVIAGGGTGGHTYPSLSVIEKIREKYTGKVEIIYIGSGSEIEKPLYESADRSYTIIAGKWARYFTFRNVLAPFKTLWGWAQSLTYLLREMPDIIFSKGGYVSFPVAFAGIFYRIPIVIHESDAIPGYANRVLGKLSKKIALGFSYAKEYFVEYKTVVTGNITRPDILGGDAKKAREMFGISESKPVILVLGGSQGSKNINNHMVDVLEEILPFTQIIHQTGVQNFGDVEQRAKQREGVKPGRRGYYPVAFLRGDEMKNVLALADVVVSRSGATSIAEIAAYKKVALLIPLASSANDHQRMNAFMVAKKKGALVLEESNLSVNVLFGKLKRLLFENDLREGMKENIKEFYFPNAAEDVAQLVVDQMNEKKS